MDGRDEHPDRHARHDLVHGPVGRHPHLRGAGRRPRRQRRLDAGILINGYDSVTVTGGQIHEFDFGVMLGAGTSQNVVHGTRVENNQEAGIGLSDADQNGQGNTIRDNVITGNSWGVALLSGTKGAVVRDNDFASNADSAVHMEQASENLVTHIEMTRSSGAGVFMQGGGQNTVAENHMTANAGGVMVGE